MQDSMKDKLTALCLRSEDVTRELAAPETASDRKRFQALCREQNELAPVVETFREYQKQEQNIRDSLELLEGESDPEMKEMLREELSASKQAVEELEEKLRILLLPKDPNDDKNVIFEIRAGAGGEEAALFAAELYRMYVHYAERRGFKVSTENVEETGLGGMKFVTFTVNGQVPETESGGRIHTSTATVAVMPEIDDDIEIDIPPEDVRMDITRASGNGGQGVNTTDSAVRLTHLPTGIVIYSQTERSQLQNKAKAWALLRSKLYDLEQEKRHDAEADLAQKPGGNRRPV